MRKTHAYMGGGEPFGVGPLFLCLLKKSLGDQFSMVIVREVCGEVLGRKVGDNVLGVCGNGRRLCIPKKVDTLYVFFPFVFLISLWK
jgi:hypothetical protein